MIIYAFGIFLSYLSFQAVIFLWSSFHKYSSIKVTGIVVLVVGSNLGCGAAGMVIVTADIFLYGLGDIGTML
jgi:hypothetical protein